MRHLAALALFLAACTQPTTDRTTDSAATVPATTETQASAPAPAATATEASATDTFELPTNLQTTPSGLQYRIDRPGTGVKPRPGQIVTVHYSGWLTDGTPFDSSRERGEPIEFPIGMRRVVRGWDEGVGDMQVGEKRTLVIPSNLGYGSAGRGAIPPNATLVFKIELLGVR